MLRSHYAFVMALSALVIGGAQTGWSAPQALSTSREVELQKPKKGFTAIAKKAISAVVFIKAKGQGQEEMDEPVQNYSQPFDPFSDEFFQRFFGGPRGSWQRQPQMPTMSQGTGFFVSADGYILTNAHVVKGAESIIAIMHSGQEMEAKLVGTDPHTDIAVLKVDGKDFPYLTLGDSDNVEIAEKVIAIGCPFQLEFSVSKGIVSGKGRNLNVADYEDYIQTDAVINPGNSGGPLIGPDGKVIGINSIIITRHGGFTGIGFAISSNMAKGIMEQLMNKGSVTRGFLGVSLQAMDKDLADSFGLSKPEGVLVSNIVKDSPADKAGLQQGDVILECNKKPIKSAQSFRNEVAFSSPGNAVTLKVNRKGKIIHLPVTLGTAVDDEMATGALMKRLGLSIENLTADIAKQLGYTQRDEGVVITKVQPGSRASLAGLRTGFLIQAVNHRRVTNITEFNDALNQTDNNKRLLLLVRQGNMTRFYSVKMD